MEFLAGFGHAMGFFDAMTAERLVYDLGFIAGVWCIITAPVLSFAVLIYEGIRCWLKRY